MARQIAKGHVTQGDAAIQQLQARYQETTADSNAYQDRVTTLQNKLNYEHTNTKVL
jgi:hypothetical protein